MKSLTANQIRQQFIDFFVDKYKHTHVPSSSLVPGGDATLVVHQLWHGAVQGCLPGHGQTPLCARCKFPEVYARGRQT